MHTIARMGAMAAFALAAVSAFGFYDQEILIKRALNSPDLTVRYSGARVAMVELRLNGMSLGTKPANSGVTSGESVFTLDLGLLSDGENKVEVRLYDKNGKLVGTETSTIVNDGPQDSQVRLSYPKMGQTVRGALDIKVGFGKELRNAYVSFFVDSQFKSLTNSAPFTFTWDTTREANGWHELEAMLVDDTSTTFKTRKVRVFVDNPGGRTDREIPNSNSVEPPATAGNKIEPPVAGSAGTKGTGGSTQPSATVTNPLPPVAAGTTASNTLNPQVGSKAGVASGQIGGTSTTGSRLVTPNVPKGAKAAAQHGAKPVIQIKTAGEAIKNATPGITGTMSIEKGTRLPMAGTFKISYNSKPISFDVQPRVQDGIALAPVRHLIEGAGGTVDWNHQAKMVQALADGQSIQLTIGDKFAKVGNSLIELEVSPFIERGRTIIPLSFLHETLNVNIEVDGKTGMVLITKSK